MEGRRENVEWEEGRREKGMCSKFHPPSNLFCFLYLILREIRGEERRDFFQIPPPLNLVLFFLSFFIRKIREVKTRLFGFSKHFILNHRRESGRKGEVRMSRGRQKEETRECILNSTPRDLFCCLYFLKIREEERREFILNSTPLEYSFVFRISFFENSEEKGEGNVF